MPIGQVFIFIIAMITFGLIMVFGYKAVQSFIGKGETVEYIKFKTDIETTMNKITTDFGSVSIETFRLPTKYEKICFVNMDYGGGDFDEAMDLLQIESAAAYDSALDAQEAVSKGEIGYDVTSENIFLEPRFGDTSPIRVSPIRVSSPDGSVQKLFECFEVQSGQIIVTLEGKGDAVEVSAPLN